MTTPGFRPTHVVPGEGLPAWDAPDPDRPTAPLDPLLPVQLAERRGDWGRVVCANGWSAWVDGRRLVAVPQDPPAAGGPAATDDDPRPLLADAARALTDYRAAVDDLAEGRLDGEAFRARTRGLRLGLVLDGASMWLYDTRQGMWVYTDGTRTTPYAADRAPRAADGDHPVTQDHPATQDRPAAADHPATRVVTPEGEV
ncbi:hypothetical protein [Streptomyces tropicalis]|uniref:Uncharacterized protein n=1 Tax=Streptomyces tropicalis TaxID=3034234 RepID=A0ABT6A9G7_9ACTN|nr:hypothetical protein [Streptomyces tropicalis]MDF3301301.1 hypothetical protein [Streptomyces tropicalis]